MGDFLSNDFIDSTRCVSCLPSSSTFLYRMTVEGFGVFFLQAPLSRNPHIALIVEKYTKIAVLRIKEAYQLILLTLTKGAVFFPALL